MKKTLFIILVFIGVVFISFWVYEKRNEKRPVYHGNKDWTINFPKKTEYVKDMPKKENLWVFLMAGQSNMAGRAFVEPSDTIPNKRILTIDKNDKWIYAKEPLHFYEPTMAGLDCGLSFSHKLLGSIPEKISIAIIPCAVGGSSIEQWLNDKKFRGVKLLSNFKRKVELSRKYGEIKGVLWHQGENDAKKELVSKYYENLSELTKKFRTIIKNDTLPILIGQIGSFAEPSNKEKLFDSVNYEIKKYTNDDKNAYLIYTGDLKDRGDKLHFNSESQRIMGERFAIKYLQILRQY